MAGGVVAALLGLGATLWGTSGSQEPARQKAADARVKPSPSQTSTAAAVGWQVPTPAVGTGPDARIQSGDGSWLTSTTYVVGTPDAVTAYRRDTGKQAWSIPLSGNICGASRTQNAAGQVAVAWAREKKLRAHCTEFGVVDLATGRFLWRTSLPRKNATPGLRISVAVTSDVAAVGWPGQGGPGASAGFALSTGKPIWAAPAKGCTSEAHAGGKELLTLSMCGQRYKVGTRDPGTGAVTWRYTAPASTRDAWIASASPLIVALSASDTAPGEERLVSVSDQGRELATWKTGEKYETGCGYTRADCGAVITTPTTLYLATRNGSGSNSVEAYDVRTGARTWQYTAGDDRTLVPLHTDGQDLIVSMLPSTLDGSRVLRLGPDGSAKLLMRMPDEVTPPDDELVDSGLRAQAYYRDGTLYMHHAGSYEFWGGPMVMKLTTAR
ncbi:PQQ-binding-like beta-propeller repeat protein [Streptomyces sp. NBC_00838]|uniref:outer membrane protein assembly factor BamB family protein n=1 Tax=Streptomyces sp. NBC_00838 TaxID=2903680 RepID=UPI00386A1F4A|nr:PQQ-binding-like beta-propeller repeat protein [Streptomyces sp. NBC_00838]